ncbi:unnamed protein product [Protopolystoma xenopodis]|uniref:Uncharacterized protein n=1 Tax=Protopolystoma xenopodis TaxID=117903 RepID=A0A3S5CV97_9PLAT|nr:unnamed protein product [Protopolystoma xenopodis]
MLASQPATVPASTTADVPVPEQIAKSVPEIAHSSQTVRESVTRSGSVADSEAGARSGFGPVP